MISAFGVCEAVVCVNLQFDYLLQCSGMADSLETLTSTTHTRIFLCVHFVQDHLKPELTF